MTAALFVLLIVAFVRFFQVFASPGLTVTRFAFLPVGLAAGAGYAAFRGWRAYKRFRDTTR
ncbi:MAG: hypothetical protein ACKVU1_09095 [bacterium]